MSSAADYMVSPPTIVKTVVGAASTGTVAFPFSTSTDAKGIVQLDAATTGTAMLYSVEPAATAATGNPIVAGVALGAVAVGVNSDIAVKGVVEKVACLTAVAAGDLLVVDSVAGTAESYVIADHTNNNAIIGRALTAAVANGSIFSCTVQFFDPSRLDC